MNKNTSKKKPDNVVFNENTKKYDASLKPYGTNVGAPSIKTPDSVSWKNKSISKANKIISSKYEEIKGEFDKLMKVYEYNNLIFNAKFSFEPIIGEIYHLYKNKNEESFLSMIAPEECDFTFLGSFYLNSDGVWEKVN